MLSLVQFKIPGLLQFQLGFQRIRLIKTGERNANLTGLASDSEGSSSNVQQSNDKNWAYFKLVLKNYLLDSR